jgi:hypothetical protein
VVVFIKKGLGPVLPASDQRGSASLATVFCAGGGGGLVLVLLVLLAGSSAGFSADDDDDRSLLPWQSPKCCDSSWVQCHDLKIYSPNMYLANVMAILIQGATILWQY